MFAQNMFKFVVLKYFYLQFCLCYSLRPANRTWWTVDQARLACTRAFHNIKGASAPWAAGFPCRRCTATAWRWSSSGASKTAAPTEAAAVAWGATDSRAPVTPSVRLTASEKGAAGGWTRGSSSRISAAALQSIVHCTNRFEAKSCNA